MGAAAVILSVHSVAAQERPRYREFEAGSDLASVAKLTGEAVSEARTIHQRPSLMQLDGVHERQKEEAEAARDALDKAKRANTSGFKP